jgi:sodium/proline symporter
MDWSLTLTFGGFVVLLVAIGLYFYQTADTRTLTDYMLAGRSVGAGPMALSEVASVASGWTFFAWVGVGFSTGLHGLWFSGAMLLVVGVLYYKVAPPFRAESEALDSHTVVDHLARRVSSTPTRRAIRLVGTSAILVFMGAYVGAQLIAVGEALDTALTLPYAASVLVGGGAVALYTTLGGFDASVWTDVVQGVLVLAAVVVLPVAAIAAIGGWTAFVGEVQAIDPTLLQWSGGFEGTALLISILSWITFAFGAIGQPHSLMRFQAIRSADLLPKAALIALAFQAVRLTVPLLIGLAGRVLYSAAHDPESVALMALTDLVPGWLGGVLLAGIIGAILSTSDSMMLVAAADLTRGYASWRPQVSQAALIRLSRVIVTVLAAGGIALALLRPGTIFDIIEFAFVGLGATLGLPLMMALLWTGTTDRGVLAGVVMGLASTVLNLTLLPDLFPILVWPVTLAAIVGISHLDR